MKKNIIFIGLILCSFSLFSKTADEYYQAGMAYEANHQFIYAMSEFYDSMIAYPNKNSFNSYYEFLRLQELIRDGYPGYVIESNEADYALEWEKLLVDFNQFWTKNSTSNFVLCSSIQESREENLVLRVQFEGNDTEKYKIISATIRKGFKNAKKNSKDLMTQYKNWADFSTIAPENEIFSSNWNMFNKAVDSYHTMLIASTFGIIPYSRTIVSFDFYDLEGTYIATTETEEVSNLFYTNINCFNEVGKNKILNGLYQIKIKDLYLEGKKIDSLDEPVVIDKETAIISMRNSTNEKKYSILSFFAEEVKRNDIRNNIELIKAKKIDELIKKYFVLVEGGKFEMGNKENPTGAVTLNYGFRSFTYTDKYLAEQIPVHIENIDSFYMMNIEVPVYFYNLIMKNIDDSFLENITLPIESISWYDAVKFCNILSSFYGLELCYYWQNDTVKCNFEANGFRLPTEVEWEYAARGGAHSSGYRYSGTNYYGDVMPEYRYLEEVRSVIPNELNIYNMSGNVSEWCWDWYTSYDLENQAPTAFKVVRGGNYNSSVKEITVYARDGFYPNALYNRGIGIRIVKKASD